MILMGDFNAKLNKANVENFFNLYNLKNLIQDKLVLKIRKTHPALTSSLQIALKVPGLTPRKLNENIVV